MVADVSTNSMLQRGLVLTNVPWHTTCVNVNRGLIKSAEDKNKKNSLSVPCQAVVLDYDEALRAAGSAFLPRGRKTFRYGAFTTCSWVGRNARECFFGSCFWAGVCGVAFE